MTAGPATKIASFVAHPLHGWKDKKSSKDPNQRPEHERLIYLTHLSEGVAAVEDSTEAQRSEILSKFKEAKPGKKERQENYNLMARTSMSKTKAPANTADASEASLPGSR